MTDSIIFYKSFYDALNFISDEVIFARVMKIFFAYIFDEKEISDDFFMSVKEPEISEGMNFDEMKAAFAKAKSVSESKALAKQFLLQAKPLIEATKRHRENGLKGGRGKRKKAGFSEDENPTSENSESGVSEKEKAPFSKNEKPAFEKTESPLLQKSESGFCENTESNKNLNANGNVNLNANWCKSGDGNSGEIVENSSRNVEKSQNSNEKPPTFKKFVKTGKELGQAFKPVIDYAASLNPPIACKKCNAKLAPPMVIGGGEYSVRCEACGSIADWTAERKSWQWEIH